MITFSKLKQILFESAASEAAKQRGLEYYGFGRYGVNGKVTHKDENDALVPVSKTQEVSPKKVSSIPKLKWNGTPKIGWWKDQKYLYLFHGTHENNVEPIAQNGLSKMDPRTGMVSMTLDPNTAHGYAAMSGGEATFRQAGQKAQSTPHEQRAVLVYKVPREWIDEFHDKKLSGNIDSHIFPTKTHMTDKTKYQDWTGPDSSYYSGSELRFNKPVPNAFLIGYMQRGA